MLTLMCNQTQKAQLKTNFHTSCSERFYRAKLAIADKHKVWGPESAQQKQGPLLGFVECIHFRLITVFLYLFATFIIYQCN